MCDWPFENETHGSALVPGLAKSYKWMWRRFKNAESGTGGGGSSGCVTDPNDMPDVNNPPSSGNRAYVKEEYVGK